MHFIGLDLAWGTANRTGVAVLDEAGRLVALDSVTSDDEIEASIGPFVAGDCVVAIDAPLLVTNDSRARPAEVALNRDFATFQAGARPTYRQHASGHFAPPRGAVLVERLSLELDPDADAPRRAIEVYPHPATVVLFELSCTLKYKRGFGDTQAERLDARRREMQELIGLLEGLQDAAPRLILEASMEWAALRRDLQPACGPTVLDLVEDQVDAVLCAYLALLFAHDRGSFTIYGDYPLNGYIATPSLPPTARGDFSRPKAPVNGRTDSSQQLESGMQPEFDRPGESTSERRNACPCGCGSAVPHPDRFVPGHDSKALHARIKKQWGSTLAFVRWFDETYRS
ncbi:DUF429 domain-containing protein [Mycolicibacterium grossiae]|uniref:DUF429 domain-containing protein n=1 Tax=Mycolicibacterium grossiae TaxID=1552759 RepID=UPI0009F6ED78|nr:DUF429 domain-containing protein [Mycolicibacterium grossiae]QEM45762.1 DUF429 domain-containing protein [Mycolicibacterium grossiae]